MAVEFKDYYATLGVDKSADPEAIKAAFRKLARKYHPDVAKNKATGEKMFKEINEAYEVLRDPDKRKRYDELGSNWQNGQQPHPGQARGAQPGESSFEFGGTGFSDFFESFFGSSFGGYGSFRRHAQPGSQEAQSGEDVEADILVTLEEALKGSVRKVTVRRVDGASSEKTHSYQVRIPPGVREGQRIRLAGQGGAGFEGGSPGDLFLRVRLAVHPDFNVKGSDLYYELDLAPWEAVLGVQVKIPTLDGATSLRIPAGTQASQQLRLKGLGLPQVSGRGDLYATVRVQVPGSVPAAERAAWEKLAANSTFNPRSP